jgi:hypothetical protein
LLYPVSLIAVLGAPILIGMIGSMVLAMATGKMNRATRLAELVPLVGGGWLTAALVLGLISAVRFVLFGPGPIEMPF